MELPGSDRGEFSWYIDKDSSVMLRYLVYENGCIVAENDMSMVRHWQFRVLED
jgi:hypothetical protein